MKKTAGKVIGDTPVMKKTAGKVRKQVSGDWGHRSHKENRWKVGGR